MQPLSGLGGINGRITQGSDARRQSVATWAGLEDTIPLGLEMRQVQRKDSRTPRRWREGPHTSGYACRISLGVQDFNVGDVRPRRFLKIICRLGG